MTPRSVALLVAAWTAGCGGGSSGSVAPTGTPTSQTITIVSGETGAVVSGARVVVAGSAATSSTAGLVSVPPSAGSDATVDVEASGFLKRETTLGRGPTITLWPVAGEGATEAWTRQVLHGTFGTGGMQRPDPVLTEYRIVADSAITGDAAAMAAVERAVGMWNAATGAAFSIRLVSGPPVNANGVVVAVIDPTIPTAGGAAPLGVGRALSGGTISFRSLAAARTASIVAHEIGHIFGIGHSPDAIDIMFPSVSVTDLSTRERLTVRLMLQRRPGKAWPDNERVVGVQAVPQAVPDVWRCGVGTS